MQLLQIHFRSIYYLDDILILLIPAPQLDIAVERTIHSSDEVVLGKMNCRHWVLFGRGRQQRHID